MNNEEPLSRIAELRAPNRYPTITRATARQTSASVPSSIRDPAAGARGPVVAQDSNELRNALEKMSTHVQNLQRALQFSVDKESGETVVKVVDVETKEVIRQIPSEELLAIANRLRSTAGILLSESV